MSILIYYLKNYLYIYILLFFNFLMLSYDKKETKSTILVFFLESFSQVMLEIILVIIIGCGRVNPIILNSSISTQPQLEWWRTLSTDPQRSFDSHRFANDTTHWSTLSSNNKSFRTYRARGYTITSTPKPIYSFFGSVFGKQMRGPMVSRILKTCIIRPYNNICNWTASFIH